MERRYLKSEDWRAAYDRFPGLESFLTGKVLERERESLKAELASLGNVVTQRRVWMEDRIAELDFWFEEDTILKMEKPTDNAELKKRFEALDDIQRRRAEWYASRYPEDDKAA